MSTRLVATALVRRPADVADLLRDPPDGVDFVELRLDALQTPDAATVREVLALPRSVPVVAAVRAAPGRLDDELRLALLAAAGEAGADVVDVDDPLLERLPATVPGERLATVHLSRFVPRIESLAQRLAGRDTRRVKLAVPAGSPVQLAELLDLQERMREGFALVTTGRLAAAGRVMAAGRGASLCYGAARPAEPGHPDQPSVASLHGTYHVGLVGPATRFHAVVGHPISHSMSPAYHNTVFRLLGQDARLVTLDVDDLQEVLAMSDALRIDGLAVTHPFKQYAVSLAATALPGALSAGSANTLLRTPTGWQARNTDWKAACDLLPRMLRKWRKAHPEQVPEVLLLGSGGAARAMVVALMEQGADITIWSRDPDHAESLAEELETQAVADLGGRTWDFVINATPVGMPGIDAERLQIEPRHFRAGALAVDLTYGAGASPFREAAADAGAALTRGEEFFALQARRQAELFTGGTLEASVHEEAVAALG